jgi:hypothetical protein
MFAIRFGFDAAFDYQVQLGQNCECLPIACRRFSVNGPVAQLGARFHGMEEVVGSIPTRSTIFLPSIYAAFLHISHRKELT